MIENPFLEMASPPNAARRSILLSALGLALGGATSFLTTSANAAGLSFREAMPAMFLNQGVWEGTYRKIDPGLHLLDSYQFRIAVTLSENGVPSYHQETSYRWTDGRSKEVLVLAQFQDGGIVWSDAHSAGRVIQIAPQVLWMQMHFAADPALDVMEINRIAVDGSARSRVSVLSRKGKMETLYIADEHRAA